MGCGLRGRLAFFALVVCSSLAGCSGTSASGAPAGDSDHDEDPCPSCNATSCTVTANCPANSHCGTTGKCEAECTKSNDTCGAHKVCTTFGSCAYTEPDPNAGVCAARVLEATLTTPTVVLLVDRSTSMNESYPGGTRWTVLRNALIDEADGVISRLASQVRFGLTLYTSKNGSLSGEACPLLNTVQPALSNYDAVSDTYLDMGPGGDTPTGESIEAVITYLSAYSEPGPKYIVLATDGEPDTCAVPNPQTGQPQAIAAAQHAHASGIDLFILSVGQGDVSLGHLQDMANAGVGLPVDGDENAPFYEANDQEQLAAAFDDIIGRVLSCVVTVSGAITAGGESLGEVYLDGDLVPFGTADGWDRIDATSIRLKGAACTKAQSSGGHTLAVQVPCYEPPA